MLASSSQKHLSNGEKWTFWLQDDGTKMLEMDGFGCGSVVDPLVLSEGARLAAGKVSLVFLVQIAEPRQERRSKPSPPIKKKKRCLCTYLY